MCNKNISLKFSDLTQDYLLYNNTYCSDKFSTFDPKTHVCGQGPNLQRKSWVGDGKGLLLVAEVEKADYLIGLTVDHSYRETMFQLLNEQCNKFPIYAYCDTDIDTPSKYTACNVKLLGSDLATGYGEVVVSGNIEKGDTKSFLPVGLAVIVSDFEALVSSNVIDSLKDYEFFGKGKPLNVSVLKHTNAYETLSIAGSFRIKKFRNLQLRIQLRQQHSEDRKR